MTDKRVPRELLAEIELARQEGWKAGVEQGWKQGRANALEEIATERAANAAPAVPDERDERDEQIARLNGLIEKQIEELVASRAERDALKAALRKHAVRDAYCHECERIIYDPGDEQAFAHAPGCLAAPEDAPK